MFACLNYAFRFIYLEKAAENNSNITLQRVLLSTLNCHVAMETPCNLLKKGDTLEDVEVVRVTKRGVYIALDNGIYNPGS